MKTNRREFIRTMAAVALVAAYPGFAAAKGEAPSSKPNVVFILADDVGWGDIGCYHDNEKQSLTPNIDRLAEKGVRMTNAHSHPVCTPSRYSLLTGEYPWRSWLQFSVLFPFEPPLIAKDRLTLPSLLKKYEYDTACIGKWHLGWRWRGVDGKELIPIKEDGVTPSYYPRTSYQLRANSLNKNHEVDYSASIEDGPTARGFDYYFGEGVINQPPFAWIENDKFVDKPTMHWNTKSRNKPDPNLWNWGKYPRPDGYASTEDWTPWDVQPTQTKKAVEYIESRSKIKKPFFLYMPLTAVHFPIVPAKEFEGKTDNSYGDFVHQMDWVVGQVIETLEKTGQMENTLLIYMSDNGACHFYGGNNGPWRGQKGDVYEGGHRVPAIVCTTV